MRIQNVNNNYNSAQRSNANPQFKANVFIKFDSFCRTREDFCEPVLVKLVQAGIATAKKTEKFGVFGKFFWVFEEGKRVGCLIIDKTTKAYDELSSLNLEPLDGDGGAGLLAFKRKILADSETKKIPLSVKIDTDCELCEQGVAIISPKNPREIVYLN